MNETLNSSLVGLIALTSLTNFADSPAKPILAEHVNRFIIDNSSLQFSSPVLPLIDAKLIRRLSFLHCLKENWDGEGADIPNEQAFFNANSFIKNLPKDVLELIKEDDIRLTPYGTVVMDFQNGKGDLISVEIGTEQLGFFTDFKSGINHKSSGVKIGTNDIPKEVVPAFNEFVG